MTPAVMLRRALSMSAGRISSRYPALAQTLPIPDELSSEEEDMPAESAVHPGLLRLGAATSAHKLQTDLESFQSTPMVGNTDTADDDVTFPAATMTPGEMLEHCRLQLAALPPLITRDLITLGGDAAPELRLMQWNALSQSLGVHNDNFCECPASALDWRSRRYRLLEEMCHYAPDLICLQEVDHFNFFKKALGTIGYEGVFFPKPDSPCLYIKGNNGPDGCALFFRSARFELLQTHSRVIEVWKVQSNQVVLLCVLRDRRSGREFCAATTHLKARSGAVLSAIRSEQGKDVLSFVAAHCEDRPVLLTGDFNAEPTEPVYSTLTDGSRLPLASVYRQATGAEPHYTSWKIRASGEACHTLDYIFASEGRFRVHAVLPAPSGESLGEARAPCLAYPSDHFSLVADLSLSEA